MGIEGWSQRLWVRSYNKEIALDCCRHLGGFAAKARLRGLVGNWRLLSCQGNEAGEAVGKLCSRNCWHRCFRSLTIRPTKTIDKIVRITFTTLPEAEVSTWLVGPRYAKALSTVAIYGRFSVGSIPLLATLSEVLEIKNLY